LIAERFQQCFGFTIRLGSRFDLDPVTVYLKRDASGLRSID
jgi:hypothetical protein